MNIARLGRRYEDIVTGWTGSCTAYTRTFGQVRVCLERVHTDGSIKEMWFDLARLRPSPDQANPEAGYS